MQNRNHNETKEKQLYLNTTSSNFELSKTQTQSHHPNNTTPSFVKIGFELDKHNAIASQQNILTSNINQQSNKLEVFNGNLPTYSKKESDINNKQTMLIQKHNKDNHKSKSNRIKQNNLQKLIPIKHKSSTLYKTTIFRNNQFVNNKHFKTETENMNNAPRPKLKRKFKNYFYEELAKKRNLKKLQQKLYKPSDSLYRELTEKCNEAYRNYFSKNGKSVSPDKIGFPLQENDEQILKKYESSWLIRRKIKDKIPLVFPIMLRENNLFASKSEEKRHEKMNDELLKIKYLVELEKDPKQKREIIVEYLQERNIEPDYITESSVQNFINFITTDFQIDIQKTLKDNIIDGIIKGNSNIKPTFVTEKGVRIISRKIPALPIKKSQEFEIKINRKPLDTCLEAQTNLTKNKPPKTDKIIINELSKELEQIKEENRLNKAISSKSEKILKYHPKHYPTQDNFYGPPIADLRLGFERPDDYYDETFALTESPKHKSDLNSIVQRLYYSKIERDPSFNVNIFKKRGKLLEYIMLERKKNKINYEQFRSQYKHIV